MDGTSFLRVDDDIKGKKAGNRGELYTVINTIIVHCLLSTVYRATVWSIIKKKEECI